MKTKRVMNTSNSIVLTLLILITIPCVIAASQDLTYNSTERNTTVLYDNLNRLLNKSSSTENVTFGYDVQFFGTLHNITFTNATLIYEYDNKMRIIKETRLIDGIRFEKSYAYDSMDRVGQQQLPTTDIDYLYNKQGNVNTIPGRINISSFSPFGSIVNRTYVNGLTTTFAYQNNNNRLLSIRTGAVQELNYTYDNVGNILSIIDTPHSLTYRMGYDYLDRLVNTTIGNDVYRYTYNPLGNLLHMTKKNETLRYVYGGFAHTPDKIITSTTAVHVYNLRNVSFGSRNITFNFSLVNELNSTLNNVNWTADWGDGTYTNSSVAALIVGSIANITVQHNYTRGGDFTVNVSAVAAGATDQQKLSIKFGTRASALTNVHLNITRAIYQFDIKNDVLENISNVNWTCAEISSTQEIKLLGNEIVNVLLDYNYSTTGTKSFTCKSDSPQGNESRTLLVDIPALVVENYNTTVIDANKRQVQFTIKNYYSSLDVNWSVTSDGQLFNGTATLANGASALVEQNITYATDGSKTIQVNVSSGSVVYDSLTDSFILQALTIENYQRINKTAIISIFDFTVKNFWPQNLTTFWNLTDPSIVNSTQLAQNQSVMVFVEHQYTTQGVKTPVVNAYSGSFLDYVPDMFTIKQISVEDQQTLYESSTKAVTELRAKSNTGQATVSWKFDSGTANTSSTNALILTSNDTLIIIENNYTSSGMYPTKAEINSSLYSDNSAGMVVT